MYFVDNDHQNNFDTLCFKNSTKGRDPEYRTAYYILSVSELYRFLNKAEDSPLAWTRTWDETGMHYEMSESFNALSHSERMLVELAQNLFNGEGDFNLMEALSVFGEEYKKVLLDAVYVREGRL